MVFQSSKRFHSVSNRSGLQFTCTVVFFISHNPDVMRHLLICFICVGGGKISSRWSARDVSPNERRDFPSDAEADACHEIQDGVEYQRRSYGSSDKKVNRITSGG